MSLNDKDLTIGGSKGVDVHPGVANPTSAATHSNPLASNFVTDPTTEDRGAGAGQNFQGDTQAKRNFAKTAGVVEGRPGIIESANIDPLNENSNKDDGWANVSSRSGAAGATGGGGFLSNAASVATGAANLAYGTAAGDEAAKKAGKEAIYGSK